MSLFAATCTPIHEDFQVDCEALYSHSQELMQDGCQGVVLFGTTGEGPSFSVEERKLALKALIQRGLDPQKIILGANSASVEDAIQLAKAAHSFGCRAVLLAPPFFFKNVTYAGVIAFYRALIEKMGPSKVKIILYHIPKYTGVAFTTAVVARLYKEFPETICGLKESAGDMAFTKELVTTLPGFSVFVGNESQIHEATKLGARGAICGLANIYPKLILSLFNRDDKAIGHIQEAIGPFPTFPAIKCLLRHKKGSAWHHMRPPLMPLDPSSAQKLLHHVAQIIF